MFGLNLRSRSPKNSVLIPFFRQNFIKKMCSQLFVNFFLNFFEKSCVKFTFGPNSNFPKGLDEIRTQEVQKTAFNSKLQLESPLPHAE